MAGESPDAPARDGKVPVLEVRGLTKRFSGVTAVSGLDLAVRAGEVHVLLGENGAGKSTLVAMISGLVRPDEGAILVDGRRRALGAPRHALRLGIGTVFQHSMLVPTLTVAENLALGGRWWRAPALGETAATLRRLAGELGLDIDPEAVAGELSLGERQQVEILRAILRGSRVLVLDEATAMLTPQGAAELGALVRRLVGRGIGVVFITHKLNEAFDIGDRITVLRQGRKVGELVPRDFASRGVDELQSAVVELMFGPAAPGRGRVPDAGDPPRPRPRRDGPPVLRVRDLGTDSAGGNAPAGISFDVAPGEVLGIAGIDGNGQKRLAEAIAGQLPYRGSVELDGRKVDGLDVGERSRLGLRYITDDRLGEGTVGSFSVALNLVLKEIGEPPCWRHGIERRDRIAERARDLVAAFDVRTPGIGTPVGRLSGGNIQKVLLARELTGSARAVICSKPTNGLDLKTTRDVRERILRAAASGIAIVLISTDLDEVLELSNRIAVMARGRLVGMVANGPEARRRVGEIMLGIVR